MARGLVFCFIAILAVAVSANKCICSNFTTLGNCAHSGLFEGCPRCVWDIPTSKCFPEIPCEARNEETCPCVESTCRHSTSFDCLGQTCIWTGSECRQQQCDSADMQSCSHDGCISHNVSFCEGVPYVCFRFQDEQECMERGICEWKTKWACDRPTMNKCGDSKCGSQKSFCASDADCCSGLSCDLKSMPHASGQCVSSNTSLNSHHRIQV